MEHPIIFNADMIGAILDGRKTQTRRIIKPQPKIYSAMHRWNTFIKWKDIDCKEEMAPVYTSELCPYGQRGNHLWVRESFAIAPDDKVITKSYWLANCGNETDYKWKPSIHMPRWASRIALEITDIRIERVKDISHRDAVAEGAPDEWFDKDGNLRHFVPQAWFENLWDSINAQRGYGWSVNPFVWVISFKRI